MHLKLERQISRSRLLGVILCYFNTSSTNSILLKLLHSNLEWTPLRLSDIVHVHGIIIRGQCFPIYYMYMLMFILVHVPVQDLYVLLLWFFFTLLHVLHWSVSTIQSHELSEWLKHFLINCFFCVLHVFEWSDICLNIHI